MKFALYSSLNTTSVAGLPSIHLISKNNPRLLTWRRSKLVVNYRISVASKTILSPIKRLKIRNCSPSSSQYTRSLTSLNNLSSKIGITPNVSWSRPLSMFSNPLPYLNSYIPYVWSYYANNLRLVCTLQWVTVALLTQNFATRPSNLYESKNRIASNYRTYATFNTVKL